MNWDKVADARSSAKIGAAMGVTKNSVIGRAHRLNLPGRASPISGNARVEQSQAQRAEHLAEASRLRREYHLSTPQIARHLGLHEDTVAKMLRPLGITTRRAQARVLPARPAQPVAPVAAIWAPPPRPGANSCRFPIGEPRTAGFRFCDAADVQPGKPYCAACCALAYTPAMPMRHYVSGRMMR